jgi:hypothetical protein
MLKTGALTTSDALPARAWYCAGPCRGLEVFSAPAVLPKVLMVDRVTELSKRRGRGGQGQACQARAGVFDPTTIDASTFCRKASQRHGSNALHRPQPAVTDA